MTTQQHIYLCVWNINKVVFLRDDFFLGLFFYFIVCLIFYDFSCILYFFVMAAKNGECVCRLLFLWQQFLLLPQRSFHVQFICVYFLVWFYDFYYTFF